MSTLITRIATPTELPWTWSSVTGDCYIMGARSLRYHGWPNFGKPIVCEVKYTVSVEEAEANKRLIIAATNSCFAVNQRNPLAAATVYPQVMQSHRRLVDAVECLQRNWEKNLTEPMQRLSQAAERSKGIIARATASLTAEVPDD